MVNTTTSDSVRSGAEGRVGSNRSCEKKITVWSRVQLPLHLDTCRNVLRIETMGGLRKWHVRNLPCTTVDDAVYSKSPPTTTPCPGRKSRPGFWRKAHGCNAEVLSMGEWWTIKQLWKGLRRRKTRGGWRDVPRCDQTGTAPNRFALPRHSSCGPRHLFDSPAQPPSGFPEGGPLDHQL